MNRRLIAAVVNISTERIVRDCRLYRVTLRTTG